MTTAAEGWEARYAGADRAWSGRVNAALESLAGDLRPGTALDLGCGEGGDALWLAAHGWTVTAVDIAPTALARGAEAAENAGLDDRITWLERDLASWEPEGTFQLVSGCFLHSMHEFPRDEILRRVAEVVAPGGRLLVVGHREPPPWHRAHHHDGHPAMEHLPGPREQVAELDLDPDAWIVEVAETRARSAVGPDGRIGELRDTVVLARRR